MLKAALADAKGLAEERKAALAERDRSLEDAASSASQVGALQKEVEMLMTYMHI